MTEPAGPHSDRNRRFEGRRIYLTGAASGIGRATAQLLAQGGAAVALVDVNADGLERVAAATGGRPFVVNLCDGDAAARSVEEAANALGGLDGVINCAGEGYGCPLDQLEPAKWDQVMALNLTAPYRICRAALPWLKAAPAASIVNIASGVALLPSGPGASVYAASKGGLLSFSKALAKELAPTIRVNTVCPGVVDTPMTAQIRGNPAAEAFISLYALKRVADPLELAEAIAFLTSSEASFITGVVLAVDGGRSFH